MTTPQDTIDPAYATVIGLEVHAQLLTRSKLFCGCPTRFGAPANTQICPVCTAFPGVLPVLNREAVTMAIKTGLAIHGHINLISEFSRKNYFYPDLPAGYQISQYDQPLVGAGHLQIDLPGGGQKTVGIVRIHLEVDAGKNLHEGIQGASWVDLNRTGVPLMEIVSAPELSSSEEAGEYLRQLRSLLCYLEVCDGNMEEGSFRCDANVSVRKIDDPRLGTRCELKNLNSIRHVMRAIDYEAARQIDLLESRQSVIQETRLWDADRGVTRSMRSKEEAHDYRYFPDPDLPPLVVDPARIETIRASLPELPEARRQRFEQAYALSPYDARVLCSQRELADYYEAVVAAVAEGGRPDPKAAANWVAVELGALLNRSGLEITQSPIPPAAIGTLIRLIQQEVISGKIAKEVLPIQFATGQDPETIIAERGLRQVSNEKAIADLVEAVVAAHPAEVAQYQAGKVKVFGFFVGKVMQASRGQAKPALVNELLTTRLLR